jgi:3-methyladenine DNA glycosylase/8-oxoguanine DNA glycosylase
VNTIPDKFAQWDAAYVLGALSSAPGDPALRQAIQATCQLDHLRSRQKVLAIAEEWPPSRNLATTYRFSAAFEQVEALPVDELESAWT